MLFLLPSLQGGGAERVIATILRHLDAARFDLVLAVLDGRHPVYRSELPANVEFIDLKCRRVRYAAPSILRLVWRRRPHVVFSTIGHLNLGVAAMRALLPRDVRLITRETLVVTALLANRRWPGVWRALYRHLYDRCDRVVCQSEDMRCALVEEVGVAAAKTLVIHNPVDLERVARLSREPLAPADDWPDESDGPVRLVAVGRLDRQKGFDLLVEAFAMSADGRLRLWILGDGPLREDLEALARERGVASRIRFLGFRANPYAFLARAHALVLSSRYEGLPNVMLEALACGTPVVATPAPGGVVEILDGRAGCVVAKDISATSLAEALARYPFEAVRQSFSHSLEAFSARRVCARYAALLEGQEPDAA